MSPSLGGPGVACSISRVRRLEAGELAGEERARVLAHVDGCARCQASRREVQAERAALAEALPFEAFAAGVAERLARAPPQPARRRLPPVALLVAANVLLLAAVPVILSVLPRPGSGGLSGERSKGGAELTVYVRDGGEGRVLAPGEPVPAGAALRVGLGRTARPYAAVALLDADGPAVLYAGPARPGPLAEAFEWTGRGRGELVLVLDDAPVDGAALARRLAAGGVGAAAPRPGAEVVVRPLARPSREGR